MTSSTSSTSKSEFPVSRLAPPFAPLDKEVELRTVESALVSSVANKLQDIAQQIELLQAKARSVIEDAVASVELHKAKCGSAKKPGQIYSLYRRPNGETYLSIMAPHEWGASGVPHEFLGSYRLEADMSWTRVENIPTAAAMERMLETLNLRDPRLLQAIAPACAASPS